MRRNLDLIIILTLSVLVCGVLYLLYDSTNDFSVSKKNNITMSRGSGSRVIPRGSVNGGIWTPEGVSGGLSSSRSVRVSPQSYRRSSMQATSTNSSLVSSSRSLMSNRSANTVSIVGGNTASFGRTAEANMSQPLAYSGGAGYPSVNVPSMRSANPVVASAPAYVGVDAGAMSAPYQSFPTVSAPNYGNSSSGILLHGGNILSDATPMYGTSCPIYKAPPVISGGTNEDGEPVNGSWLNWLDNSWKDGSGYGSNVNGDGTLITLTYGEAYEAWLDMTDNKGEDDDSDSWNENMGNATSWESFLEWLKSNGGRHGNYQYVPIGDVAPLFLIAFIYMVMMFVRKRKAA